MKIFTPNTIIRSSEINGNLEEIVSQFSKCVNRKDNATNNDVTDQLIQHGWGFVNGNGSFTMSITVTLPVAFDDTNIDITATCLGYKSGSDPSSRTDFGLQGPEFVSGSRILSSSQVSITLHRSDDAVFVSGTRIGFSWIAIGTKAR